MSTSSSPYHQYLDSAGQRLDRYIADIQKGFAVIVVAGAPVALIPKLLQQFLECLSPHLNKRPSGARVYGAVITLPASPQALLWA